MAAHPNQIIAGFHDPCSFFCVIGRKILGGKANRYLCRITGRDHAGFYITFQFLIRFRQPSSRGRNIYLHHFSAGYFSGIANFGCHPNLIPVCGNGNRFHRKVGITQTKTKRILHIQTEAIKPTVSHKDILVVILVIRDPVIGGEGLGSGIILIPLCPCVRQSTGRIDLSSQNIRQSIATFHACLSHQNQSRNTRDFIDPYRIDDTGIEHNDGVRKIRSHRAEILFLSVRQVVIALFRFPVKIFTGISANHINGSVCCRCRLEILGCDGRLHRFRR